MATALTRIAHIEKVLHAALQRETNRSRHTLWIIRTPPCNGKPGYEFTREVPWSGRPVILLAIQWQDPTPEDNYLQSIFSDGYTLLDWIEEHDCEAARMVPLPDREQQAELRLMAVPLEDLISSGLPQQFSELIFEQGRRYRARMNGGSDGTNDNI